MGRTRAKRLRGFGNAIVLPLATVFVASVIDSLGDAAREIEDSLDKPAVVPVQEIAQPVSDPVGEPTGDEQPAAPGWTGPLANEVAPSGMLFGRVPGDRWPYGPPPAHEPACNLFPHRGSPGGLFCDCAASAADAMDQGVSA